MFSTLGDLAVRMGWGFRGHMFSPFGGGYHGYFDGGFFPWFFIIRAVIWLIVLSLIVYFVVRYFKGRNQVLPETSKVSSSIPSAAPESKKMVDEAAASALAVLNERYVRGELDDETYLRMKANIIGGLSFGSPLADKGIQSVSSTAESGNGKEDAKDKES